MRWITVAASCAAFVAAFVLSACGTGATAQITTGQITTGQITTAQITTGQPPSVDRCYAFAVSAVRRHVIVRRLPPPCDGLTQAQVNEVVGRAIRTAVGPHPKAIARRLAAADSRYLGDLVKPVPAPPAALAGAGQPAAAGQLGIRLGALGAWLATAIPGAYLLTAWLTNDGRRRVIRKPGVPSAVPLGHAGLALAGLCIWIAFTVTGTAALAWADVGLTWVIAGLGMSTLLAASPEHRVVASAAVTATGEVAEASSAPFPSHAPVIIIAVHGALATLTILLVLLAAVGIG